MSRITHWNYRVIQGRGKIKFLSIHEVFYYKNGKISMTENAVPAWGLNRKELKKSLRRMIKALDKPILDYKTGN